MTSSDPISVARALDAAVNAGDLDRALALFADDAVVALMPPPPSPIRGVFAGRQQIREWLEGLGPGFHVESRDYRAEGNRVTFRSTVTSEGYRRQGISAAETITEMVVENGRISRLTPALSPETLVKAPAAVEVSPR